MRASFDDMTDRTCPGRGFRRLRLKVVAAVLSMATALSLLTPSLPAAMAATPEQPDVIRPFATVSAGPGTVSGAVSAAGAEKPSSFRGIIKYSGERAAAPASVAELFDADYYLLVYPELRTALSLSGQAGSLTVEDRESLFRNFMTEGLARGRKCSPWLDLFSYRASNEDLRTAFGENWDGYVAHYFRSGIDENRSSGSSAEDLGIRSALESAAASGLTAAALLQGNAPGDGLAHLLQMYSYAIPSGANVIVPAYTGENAAAQMAADTAANSGSSGGPGSSGSPSGGSGPDPAPAPEPAGDTMINALARKSVTGYVLYKNEEGEGNQFIDNGSFNGWFYPDTYRDIISNPALIRDQRDYTVMVYLCGTDLEDRAGIASTDLVNLLKAQYDLDRVNVLVLAGGTLKWASDTMKEYNNNINCCLYYLDPNGIEKGTGTASGKTGDERFSSENKNNVLTADKYLEDGTIDRGSMRLLANFGQVDMGDSELLLGFLDTAYDLFPADHYWLSMWNHGSGSTNGLCFSDTVDEDDTEIYNGVEITGKGVSLARLEEALHSSKIYREKGKLDILSAEACMMAGIEVAYNLSPYVDFLVASEEMTYGTTCYDQYLNCFRAGRELPEVEDIAVNASHSYMETHTDQEEYSVTNACFDLSAMNDWLEKMNTFGTAMLSLLEDDQLSAPIMAAINRASARSVSLGHSENNGDDYLDMYDFINRLDIFLNAECRTLEDAGNAEGAASVAAARQAIAGLKEPKFILYRGQRYMGLFGYDHDAVFDDPQSIDMSDAVYEGHWKSLEYGDICNINLYLPFKTRLDKNYANESVFPGYVAFLRKYSELVRKEEQPGGAYEKAAMALREYYGRIFSGIEVHPYTWEEDPRYGTAGKIHNDVVVRITFNTETGSEAAAGMDPVEAFAKTVHHYNLKIFRRETAKPLDENGAFIPQRDNEGEILRDEQGQPVPEEKSIDMLISSSGDLYPSMYLSGDVSIRDDGDGFVLTDDSSITIDTSVLEMVAYYVTGYTAGSDRLIGTEDDEYCMDWGTPAANMDKYNLADYNHPENPDAPVYKKENVRIMDGAVYYLDRNKQGEQSADAGLIFAWNSNLSCYEYLGAVIATPKPDEDSEYRYTAVKIGSEEDDIRTSAVLLYHYMIENNAVNRVEGNGGYALDRPEYEFGGGRPLPVLSTLAASDPNEKGSLDPSYNKYALELASMKITVYEGSDTDPSGRGCLDPEKYPENDMRVGSLVTPPDNTAGDGDNTNDRNVRTAVAARSVGNDGNIGNDNENAGNDNNIGNNDNSSIENNDNENAGNDGGIGNSDNASVENNDNAGNDGGIGNSDNASVENNDNENAGNDSGMNAGDTDTVGNTGENAGNSDHAGNDNENAGNNNVENNEAA